MNLTKMRVMTVSYFPRPTQFQGIIDVAGWRLKHYLMTTNSEPLPDQTDLAARNIIAATLASEAPDELGVGFVIVHQGAEAVWLLIDMWRGDIICQRGFRAELDDPSTFVPIEVGGPTVCIWELEVFGFERDALITHILRPDVPDIEAYLSDRFDNTVAISNLGTAEEFCRAWDAGDVDALMAVMSDNPTYRASTGLEPGRTYSGVHEVRAGFAAVIAAENSSLPVPSSPREVLAVDDRALSFWSYAVGRDDGSASVVEGIDVWTFDDGRIAVKDAYRKSFPDLHGPQ